MGGWPGYRKNPKPEKCLKTAQNPHHPLHALLACFCQTEPCGFTTRLNEYADDVNRACGDGRELIYCVYERANVS